MKSKKYFASLFILIFILIAPLSLLQSCNENTNECDTCYWDQKSYDTVFPLDYIPAYPGSHWIYNNGDTIKCGEKYQIHAIFSTWDMYSGVVVSDSVYVPIYENKYLKGYEILLDEKFCSPYQWCGTIPIFSEKVGDTWSDCYDDPHMFEWGYDFSKNIAKDTFIKINSIKYDSVIIVANCYYNCNLCELDSGEVSREYYAKNIGLIKKDYFDTNRANENFEIVKYFINK